VNLRDFVTIKDAAALVGVHPETLRRWDASGKLIAQRHPVNRYRLYSRADLYALLAELKESSGSRVQTAKRRDSGRASKCASAWRRP